MPDQKKRTFARPVSPATLAFAREARRTPGYSLFDWIHGYVYARWPYLYIGIGTGEHPLARIVRPVVNWFLHLFPAKDGAPTFADTYHGKVVPLKEATQLVTIEEEITLTDLEQVIPYARARDIIMRNPHHIVVLDCPCRAARPDPCLPLDVCLVIGEPFAGFVAEHHPNRSRWITPQEAVDILRAEDERGHVHHAFFKDAMLGRFYAICNCCSCCCGAMQAHRHGTPMLASSGYICRVDSDTCIGCGICTDFCQFDALSMNGKTVVVDSAECMGCGACISKCPQQALSLMREPSKGEPLEIHQLTASVAS
jgi:NAD-dependent dihydropyrimidine dehydrogenase PreA subunit